MLISYRDLSIKDPALKKKMLEAVEAVLTHGRILLGPELIQFEEEIAKYCQKRYCVGVGSGTDALFTALRALGIGPDDEVITTPLTWVATTNAIVMTGATPVFVDITDDLNLDASLVEEKISKKTKAIVPVHFTGRMCNMDMLTQLSKQYGLKLVEDAAQAFGASIDGKVAGSFSEIGVFSMNPMKILCAYGEAGACVTDDKDLLGIMQSLRYAGTINKEDCVRSSLNGRLDTIQAAMLLVNLRYLDDKIQKRRKIARMFNEQLKNIVICPEFEGPEHVFYSYTIIAEKRDELAAFLAQNGIETKIQHPVLMPHHTAYQGKYPDQVPIAEKRVEQILCIPNEENLSEAQIHYIIDAVKAFYGVN